MEKREIRILDVHLTEQCILEYGKEQAEKLLEVVKLEGERRAINAKIKPLNERIDHLAHAIDSGIEAQEVECIWEFFWDLGMKHLIRPDTGEIVSENRIEDWERQERMEV